MKEEAIKVIESLPDDVDLVDIIKELYVRYKIEEGLKDIEKGNVVSHEEIKKEFACY